MSKNLSQVVTDLFSKPSEGKELSAQIQRLGLEIRLVIQSEDTIYGKFHGLLESFREILPDETQRYQAALKALTTTSKLSRLEISKALAGQIEELKTIEKSVVPALSGWRDELKTMEVRLQELRGEMATLRARIAQIEGEEKTAQAAMEKRQKDLDTAEKTIAKLFEEIGAEIGVLSKRVEELTAEAPVAQSSSSQSQPTREQEKRAPEKKAHEIDALGSRKTKESERKAEIHGAAPQEDTRFQRKCPMCGGPFNLLQLENIWQCYTCAYEEPNS